MGLPAAMERLSAPARRQAGLPAGRRGQAGHGILVCHRAEQSGGVICYVLETSYDVTCLI